MVHRAQSHFRKVYLLSVNCFVDRINLVERRHLIPLITLLDLRQVFVIYLRSVEFYLYILYVEGLPRRKQRLG